MPIPRLAKLLFFTLFLVFVMGCDTAKRDGASAICTIKIHVPEERRILLLSEVIDDIRYLRLEEKNAQLIGNIDKIICDNNNFYILDRDATKSLFVFSSTGKFLFQINKPGKGPGNYMRPDDFIVDAFANKILILDINQRKLLTFSIEGHFETETILPFRACSFTKLANGFLTFYMNFIAYPYNNKNYNLLVLDGNSIKSSFFPFEPGLNRLRLTPQTVFSSNFTNWFITPVFNDTIFQINGAGITPHYVVDFDKGRLPKDFFLDNKTKTIDAQSNELNGFCHMIQHYEETSKHVSFSFSYKQQAFMAFYSRSSLNTKVGGLIGNDIDGGPFSYPIALRGEELVAVYEPADLIEVYERGSSRLSPDLASLSKSLNELSNPVLAFYKFKNF